MGYPERCDRRCRASHTTPHRIQGTAPFAGKKISIALKEMGLAHTLKPVDIGSNVDQFTDNFKAINPNSKIPVIGA